MHSAKFGVAVELMHARLPKPIRKTNHDRLSEWIRGLFRVLVCTAHRPAGYGRWLLLRILEPDHEHDVTHAPHCRVGVYRLFDVEGPRPGQRGHLRLHPGGFSPTLGHQPIGKVQEQVCSSQG